MDVFKFNFDNEKVNDSFKSGSIMILGKFNIFHKGHLSLLNKAQKIRTNEKIGILIIEDENSTQLLTLENKLRNLEKLNFDFVVIAQFTFEFKSMSGDEFISKLNNLFNVKTYIVGQDFKFGNERKSNAEDICKMTKANVIIEEIKTYNEQKISSSTIKQMHEFGEYNLIKNLVVNPLEFDVTLINRIIKWDQKIAKPHYGNYFFMILLDNYWYHGLINFSINGLIKFKLINFNEAKEIYDQQTKIKILDIERIITNRRFDDIIDDDITKTKLYFSI